MSNGALVDQEIRYDDDIVRKFLIATMVWGGVAFLLGVIVAAQMAFYQLNLGLPWTSFGRLRPLHTNAAIFAFAGNAIFAGVYFSTQRLLRVRMGSDFLSRIHFWGWQLIILLAAITIPLGLTQGKEYAELEWPIDILIAVVWVVFAVNFFIAVAKRREKHMYVALWFYIATLVTIAVLHIVNSIAIPVGLFKSYSVYAGAQDALVQWWYGHNAVAFFLTTPFLGLMYYFIPKATGRPIYSYKLSIIHFWSLVFLYIWAGPHHLLYTALPEWAQTLGMVFSVMLWAPSWGGFINGLLTIRGVWSSVRTNHILKFFVAGLTFYAMSTFEGPLLSIKSVSALAHYTDWIIGHVHSGTLGWNGFMTFGMIYYLVPVLWKTKLYNEKWAHTHFWMGTLGILLYIVSMWASGITQGLMLREITSDGKLAYPDFIETVVKILPLYYIRLTGGLLFLGGFVLMAVNVTKTISLASKPEPETSGGRGTALAPSGGLKGFFENPFHESLEGMPAIFTVLCLLAILVGSIIEILPTLTAHEYVAWKTPNKPYRALELAGRDVYVREGCYLCHSQMIRPLLPETLRYGAPSTLEESMNDHPFQWGSRRTGPDLARVGVKYPDFWHFRHLIDPREISPNSIMPAYSWLAKDKTNFDILPKKLRVMQTVGVPYKDDEIEHAVEDAKQQATQIVAGMKDQNVPENYWDREIIALIAYIQRLGKNPDVKVSSGGAP